MKDERVYLEHIRDAIVDIEQYTSVGRDAFLTDRMRQDAVIRKLEIIGEAVKRLGQDARNRRPEIPWKQIAGRRHRAGIRQGGGTYTSLGPWGSTVSSAEAV